MKVKNSKRDFIEQNESIQTLKYNVQKNLYIIININY
jgi:hypothetical protein